VGSTLGEATTRQEKSSNGEIRVSVGTAIALGLLEGKLDVKPTTAYLMTHRPGKCEANCAFCPQARSSNGKAELLSRVSWPLFSTSSVIEQIGLMVESGNVKRVCIQALNYPQVFDEICAFVRVLKNRVSVQVSVTCQPEKGHSMWLLAQGGVDRIGIAVDAATEGVFKTVKGEGVGGPYEWNREFLLLRTAVGVFGEGNVSTHLIVGLGETEKECSEMLQSCVDISVTPGLFAFTPVNGTALSGRQQPTVEVYRRVQLARYLIVNSFARFQDMAFDEYGKILDFGVGKNVLSDVVRTGRPFQTSGCKDCNRPFYNEKPGGPLFNFPRELSAQEITEIESQLESWLL
jgi:biotin synthase-related radical SAM superfamily protein